MNHLFVPTKIMSEYYMKIALNSHSETKCTYFDNRVYKAPYCFSGFFQKMESQAHFNTKCFTFAEKTMTADANQLQDLHEFLRAGDVDSFRRFIKSIVCC